MHAWFPCVLSRDRMCAVQILLFYCRLNSKLCSVVLLLELAPGNCWWHKSVTYRFSLIFWTPETTRLQKLPNITTGSCIRKWILLMLPYHHTLPKTRQPWKMRCFLGEIDLQLQNQAKNLHDNTYFFFFKFQAVKLAGAARGKGSRILDKSLEGGLLFHPWSVTTDLLVLHTQQHQPT